MISVGKHIAFVLLITVFLQVDLNAQYINLNLKVEAELSTTVEQELTFGTQLINSGISRVNLGDANMGIFRIRGINTQNVYIELSYPEFLEPENTVTTDRIPLELKLAYNNKGKNNPRNSIPLDTNQGWIPIHKPEENQRNVRLWQELYIYLYGNIDIGNLSTGTYSADVLLVVDYD